MSMNKFIGIGRWSSEIELKYTPTGKAVANTNIAINEYYGGNETTTYLPVVMWGKTAENVAQYSSKGRLVAIEGKIRVRSWETENGKRYVTEVIADNVRFLESNREGGAGGSGTREESPFGGSNNRGGGFSPRNQNDPFSDDGKPIDIPNDYLPF
ncbi:single-stranded DNA-binding protein [Paenibacillus sp. HMSSN-139]|nr:single-stranded DNA-binding protein [Paenibacillus sp. HMSSN-139]